MKIKPVTKFPKQSCSLPNMPGDNIIIQFIIPLMTECLYALSHVTFTPNLETSLVAQMVKDPPAMGETQVQSLSHKDSLEKEITTHFSILAWETPQTEETGGLQSWDCRESDMTERLTLSHDA